MDVKAITYHIGDKVFGRSKAAQIPKRGGIVQRIVSKGYYYINHISGGGIGYRDKRELCDGR